MTIEIEQAGFEFLDDIVRMSHDIWVAANLGRLASFDEKHMINFAAGCIYEPDKLALVAVEGEARIAVGTLLAIAAPIWWHPSREIAQEMLFWVDPTYRKRGVGARLIVEFEQWATLKGFRIVGLSRSGTYDVERLGAMCRHAGYGEESVIFTKEIPPCRQ